MVKYLVDTVNQIYTVQNIESLEEAELAEMLLEEILEKGMMPPRWIPEDDGYTYGDEPSGEPNGFNISVYKWEPEDA